MGRALWHWSSTAAHTEMSSLLPEDVMLTSVFTGDPSGGEGEECLSKRLSTSESDGVSRKSHSPHGEPSEEVLPGDSAASSHSFPKTRPGNCAGT